MNPGARFAGRLLALAAAFVWLAGSRSAWQRADDDQTPDAPTSEGPLDNDVFVPIAEEAARDLSSGDRVLERARATRASGPAAEAARLLDSAFEHWREALASGGTGASSWLESAAHDERRLAEGLRAGLVRRLAALSPEERARWKERLAPGADLALRSLPALVPLEERAARLREVVRLFPLTPAASKATVELVDLALEAGLRARARGWVARGLEEARLADESAALAALGRRRAALAPENTEEPEGWATAVGCDFVDSSSWNEATRRASEEAIPLERRPRPGGAFLAGGRFAVQTTSALHLFSLSGAGELEAGPRLRPADYLGGYAPDTVVEAPSEPPGWPFLPLVDGDRLVLVVGRTRPAEPNALLALELPEAHPLEGLGLELGRAEPGARLAWAIVGAERLEEQQVEPVPGLEELGDYEFQPGPVASGDLIVVQARRFDGQVLAWLLAFDRRDGTLVWARALASGADRIARQRFAETTKRVAGQALLALEDEHGARVFAGTHLGLGVLFDPLLGEPLWSLKNRRRPANEPGWDGSRPAPGTDASGARVVLWAPMDSDRVYTLRPFPLDASAASSVLVRPPAPLFHAQALLGGDAEEHLVLDGGGAVRNLSARRPGSDRVDSLDLGQDERFRGQGLLSPQRAWVCTNRGLYLFDRTRELYLLDHAPLPSAGGGALGGDVLARGRNVLVVGTSALWSFLAR